MTIRVVRDLRYAAAPRVQAQVLMGAGVGLFLVSVALEPALSPFADPEGAGPPQALPPPGRGAPAAAWTRCGSASP